MVAEVDGAQHMEVSTWWDDLDRQNDLVIDDGKTVIRFVGLALKARPGRVVTRLHDCLRAKRPDLHDQSSCKVCRLVASGRL
jgi:very-short-patch-repair endonuclease